MIASSIEMDAINPWWSSKDRKMVAKAEDVGSTAGRSRLRCHVLLCQDAV